MNDFDKRKIENHCPCLFEVTNRAGQQRKAAPTVDCSMKCETCGWNPKEQERRVKGGMKNRPDGGKKFVFRRADA